MAVVNALNLDDMTITASASISSWMGQLDLTPGRYLISVEVVAGDQFFSSSQPFTHAVEDTLNYLFLSLNMTNGVAKEVPSIASPAAAPKRSHAKSAASGNASDGLPKPRVVVVASVAGNSMTAAEAADWTRQFTGWVRTAAGADVSFVSQQDQQAAFQSIADQLLNGSDIDLASAMASFSDNAFVISLTFYKLGLNAAILSTENRGLNPLRRADQKGAQFTGGMVLQAASQMGIGLFPVLRASQDLPLLPQVDISGVPEEILIGTNFTATISLKDRNNAPGTNKPIILSIIRPSVADTRTVQTDNNGLCVVTTFSGSSTGLGQLKATYNRRQIPYEHTSYFRVLDSSDLVLTSPVGGMHPGDSAQVCANLHFGSQAIANTVIHFSALGGIVSPAEATTDANGRACTTFTAAAANQSAIANVSGQCQEMVQGQPVTRTANCQFDIVPAAMTTVSASATNIMDAGATGVTVETLVGGSRVPSLPVQMYLAGAGSLSATAGQTDENGQAIFSYQAPATGDGSATIYGTTMVNNQPSYNAVTITYNEPPRIDVTLSDYLMPGKSFPLTVVASKPNRTGGRILIGQAAIKLTTTGGATDASTGETGNDGLFWTGATLNFSATSMTVVVSATFPDGLVLNKTITRNKIADTYQSVLWMGLGGAGFDGDYGFGVTWSLTNSTTGLLARGSTYANVDFSSGTIELKADGMDWRKTFPGVINGVPVTYYANSADAECYLSDYFVIDAPGLTGTPIPTSVVFHYIGAATGNRGSATLSGFSAEGMGGLLTGLANSPVGGSSTWDVLQPVLNGGGAYSWTGNYGDLIQFFYEAKASAGASPNLGGYVAADSKVQESISIEGLPANAVIRSLSGTPYR